MIRCCNIMTFLGSARDRNFWIGLFFRNWLFAQVKHCIGASLYSYQIQMRPNFDQTWSKLSKATTSYKRFARLQRSRGSEASRATLASRSHKTVILGFQAKYTKKTILVSYDHFITHIFFHTVSLISGKIFKLTYLSAFRRFTDSLKKA